MVRKSLIVAAMLVVASPLAAQDEGWVWTNDRPDGDGPVSITGIRTLDMGAIEFEYQWIQRNYQGVWFGKDSLDLATTLQLYEVAPLSLSDRRHSVSIGYGVTDALTVRARGEFAFMEREQLRDDGVYFITSTSALGDIYLDATYNALRTGPYRMDVNVGVVVPLGKSATYAVSPYSMPAEEILPYDMRPGGGSFGMEGALSAEVQNERASLGGKFQFLTYLNENSRDYTLGDRYEANGWAGINLNESFALLAGVRWEKWGNIDGSDTELTPIQMRDPMNDGVFLGGIRASMPFGLTFVGPMGTQIAGHRISFETQYTLHHDYEGPQIGMDWGINLGYTVPF